MPTANLKKPIKGVALATALVLLIPAIAMQFTTEVAWGPGDFVLAAALLFGAGVCAVFGFGQLGSKASRIALVLGIAGTVALIWAELAVGLFD